MYRFYGIKVKFKFEKNDKFPPDVTEVYSILCRTDVQT